MKAKEFFKRFVWGTFFPTVVFLAVGIYTAAFSSATSGGVYYEFITASLLLLTGACMLAYYLLGNTGNIAFLLSAVGTISVCVYLYVPSFLRWSVIPIAFGVLILLRAATEALEAFGERKSGGKVYLVRIVLAAAFAACGIVSCVRPFATTTANWIFTGVVMIAEAVVGGIFLVRGGLFREEEQLKFRPVKKPSPAEKGAEEEKSRKTGARKD